MVTQHPLRCRHVANAASKPPPYEPSRAIVTHTKLDRRKLQARQRQRSTYDRSNFLLSLSPSYQHTTQKQISLFITISNTKICNMSGKGDKGNQMSQADASRIQSSQVNLHFPKNPHHCLISPRRRKIRIYPRAASRPEPSLLPPATPTRPVSRAVRNKLLLARCERV